MNARVQAIAALGPVAVIGVGRAGSCVAASLVDAGAELRWVVARDAVRRGVARAALPTAVDVLDAVPSEPDPAAWAEGGTWVLAVPDRAIAAAAAALAPPSGVVVLHLSGVTPAQVASTAGCYAGSCHPLAALPDGFVAGPEAARGALEGAVCALDGDPVGIARAEALAVALGGVALPVAAEARPSWHAAAAIVANDLVGLLLVGGDLAEQAGVPAAIAERGLLHLARTSLAAVSAAGGPMIAGLTGAVARGDASTIARHLTALGASRPEARAAHRSLSRILLNELEQTGRLGAQDVAALRRVLDRDDAAG